MTKGRKIESIILRVLIYAAAAVTFAVLLFLLAYILINGVPNLKPSLFSLEYNTENASLMPALINTVIMTLLSLVIAIPFGIFSAIFLVEYAKKGNRFVGIIRLTTETLQGIPSIVYGLFGMLFFVTALGWGYSILAGAFTMSIMILPLIMRTTEEALKAVPDTYREGSFGLGAGKLRTIFRIVLPAAVPGIMAGVILAIGRIFYADFGLFFQLPRDSGPLYDVTQVIDTYVYRALKETGNVGMASAASLYQSIVGFVLVVGTNLVVRKMDPDSALF